MKTAALCAGFVVLFVAGRLTKGQEHALENYWPVMGVEFSEEPVDFAELFGRDAPVTLEIGFGMGASLVAMAKARPEQNFLGIEVHSLALVRVWLQPMKRVSRTCASCAMMLLKSCIK